MLEVPDPKVVDTESVSPLKNDNATTTVRL
jgi:hypothetical protein